MIITTIVNQIETTKEEDNDEESFNYIVSYGELNNQVYKLTYDSESDDNHVAPISSEKANEIKNGSR